MSISLGVLWGIFPVIGTSTLLCTLSSLALRLNMIIIQAVNYAVYPIQIALLLPYYQLGHLLTGYEVTPANLTFIETASFSMEAVGGLSGDVALIAINMLVGWISLAPIVSIFVYFIANFALTYGITKIEKRIPERPNHPIDPLSND